MLRALAALTLRLKEIRAEAAKSTPERTAWETTLATQNLWSTLGLQSASATSGAKLVSRTDGALIVSGVRAEKEAYTLSFIVPAGALF